VARNLIFMQKAMRNKQDPTNDSEQQPGAEYPRDRRQTPRLEVLGHVHGHIVSLDARMTALDLGFGGFSMETTFPVEANQEHDFRLIAPNGAISQLRARAAYCRRYKNPSGTPRYVSGLVFVDPAEPPDELIDQLLAVLTFDAA
jgi:hypothetical protein